jgi:hypothetical protein
MEGTTMASDLDRTKAVIEAIRIDAGTMTLDPGAYGAFTIRDGNLAVDYRDMLYVVSDGLGECGRLDMIDGEPRGTVAAYAAIEGRRDFWLEVGRVEGSLHDAAGLTYTADHWEAERRRVLGTLATAPRGAR